MIEIDNYIYGLLYGDGHISIKDKYECFLFTTTHKELVEKVKSFLSENNIKFGHHHRDYSHFEGHKKEKYEVLEILETYDKEFIKTIKDRGFQSENVEERIIWNGDFIRGFLETKGTLFQFMDHKGKNESWRLAFSGSIEDMTYLKEKFDLMGTNSSQLLHRNERRELGIISKSYRLPIQNREGIKIVLDFLDGENKSLLLKERIDGFNHFYKTFPYRSYKVFKHYKYASQFMARNLNLDIHGVRGGVSLKNKMKPIYLWENGKEVLCFYSWENVYKWLSEIYLDETGVNPPLVEPEK